MVGAGTQRKNFQILTGIGFIISIGLLIFFKQHPTYFQVGGIFQSYLGQLGFFAPLIFMLLQVIQVVYPIIPGGMTSVIGYIAFGPIWGFIYNFTGIFTGSLLAFGLTRRYGETFVKAFVSQETYDKYVGYLDRNDGKFYAKFLGAAFALPGFPDDFLCMVSGLSKMTWKKFITIFLIAKPVTLYIYTVVAYRGLNYLLTLFH
ncbi:TVP38/TMEM64 family protein [Streptococcus macedonicus]|uniref:TVP38/TMEM64 family protein n=1 Tax=Streptococcus macedonicus TaxID=59310 RepID=UPI001898CFB7|nr:VTT domain-containing protein [Streptococcus macedonicus]MBF6975987.1 TVP38/TMEM64 family protein [Streptococcus macedonicus]